MTMYEETYPSGMTAWVPTMPTRRKLDDADGNPIKTPKRRKTKPHNPWDEEVIELIEREGMQQPHIFRQHGTVCPFGNYNAFYMFLTHSYEEYDHLVEMLTGIPQGLGSSMEDGCFYTPELMLEPTASREIITDEQDIWLVLLIDAELAHLTYLPGQYALLASEIFNLGRRPNCHCIGEPNNLIPHPAYDIYRQAFLMLEKWAKTHHVELVNSDE